MATETKTDFIDSREKHRKMMPPREGGPLLPQWAKIALAATYVLVLLVYSFLSVVTWEMNHNEHMYISAGRLLLDYNLYTEYAYLQTPVLPNLYWLLYLVTGTSYLTLKARLLQWLLVNLAMVLLYVAVRRLSGNKLFAIPIPLLFLANTAHATTIHQAANYVLPVIFMLAAFICYLRKHRGPGMYILTGLFLSLAVSTKLTYVFMVPPFIIGELMEMRKREKKETLRSLGFHFLGGFIGIIPCLYYYITRPQEFMLNNVTYHLVNSEWVGEAWGKDSASVQTWNHLNDLLREPGAVILFTLLLISMATAFSTLGGKVFLNRFLNDRYILVTVMTAILGAIGWLSPHPIVNEYYLLFSIPAYLVVGAFSFYASSRITPAIYGCMIAALLMLPLKREFWVTFDDTFDPDDWPALEMVRDGRELRELMEENGVEGKVIFLRPAIPLEAGLEIYNEFASGPFLYRSGDLDDTPDLQTPRVRPSTVYTWMEQEKPPVVMVGKYPREEEPMIAYCEDYGYLVRETTRFTVYLRPEAE